MSSSDFLQIAASGGAARAERLFRASVSAFCALTRPSRREAAQLEDLTLSLIDDVSIESRRFVAAAMSECRFAPPGLVRRLADESVDIAAPLLIRSAVLTDIDLIALIGRHGIAHARAIGRRPALHTTIVKLVAALEARTASATVQAVSPPIDPPEEQAGAETPAVTEVAAADAAKRGAEGARERLRRFMHEAAEEAADPFGRETAYRRLRDTALTGNAGFFCTALADAFSLGMDVARSILDPSSYAPLMIALRALELSEERALLVVSAVYGGQAADAEGVRLFLLRYRLLTHEAAMDRVGTWKARSDALSAGPDFAAANAPGRSDAERLRAS